MSMSVADNNAVVQASKARLAARAAVVMRVIRERYVIERIMRLTSEKALKSDKWSYEINLGWSAGRALRDDYLAHYITEDIVAELKRRNFDIPMHLFLDTGRVLQMRLPLAYIRVSSVD